VAEQLLASQGFSSMEIASDAKTNTVMREISGTPEVHMGRHGLSICTVSASLLRHVGRRRVATQYGAHNMILLP
jgi:hypothetical protein